MTSPLKLNKPEGPGAGRRSTRISIAIPITLSGKDASGRAFKENTRTVILNKHGAKIVTVHQLALGTELLLENRALGRTASTTVTWLGDRPSPRDPAEIGIQLAEAENIWGIELPPDDWQEGPPAKEVRQEISKTPGPVTSAIPTASSSAPPASEAAAAPSRPRPTAGPPPPTPPVPTEVLARSDISARTPAKAQESAGQIDRPLDTAIEQQVREIEKRLNATRAELDALQARIQESRESIDLEAGKAQRDAQASVAQAVQNASGELNEKVRQCLEAITVKAEEHQAHLSRRSVSILEELRSKSGLMLEGFQTDLDRTLSAAKERAAREALDDFRRASSELMAALVKDLEIKASSSMEPRLEELREASGTAVAEGRKQLSTLSRQMQTALEKEASSHAEDHIVALRKQLQDFQGRGAHEIEEGLKGVLEKNREAMLSQVQTQLGQVFLTVQEKSLAEFREKIREELLKQLEEAAGEFDKRTQENLELFSHELTEKKEVSVAQATEMFRSTIGQMFLAPRPDASQPAEAGGTKKRP